MYRKFIGHYRQMVPAAGRREPAWAVGTLRAKTEHSYTKTLRALCADAGLADVLLDHLRAVEGTWVIQFDVTWADLAAAGCPVTRALERRASELGLEPRPLHDATRWIGPAPRDVAATTERVWVYDRAADTPATLADYLDELDPAKRRPATFVLVLAPITIELRPAEIADFNLGAEIQIGAG
jgi:hypothetical protein